MHVSDGMGTYLTVSVDGNFLHIDARANTTVMGLTYVVMLAFILYRIRRNHERRNQAGS